MKFFLLTMLVTFSFSGFTKEGGNGGGVIVCGKKYELYDFYEGQSPRGHNIKLCKADRRTSRDEYITRALNHIQKDIPHVSELVNARVKEILAIPSKELLSDIEIPVIYDATVSVMSEGCYYEQAANWDERFGKLFISQKVYKKLDSMNQAGLIIHEAIYKLSRETKVATETSDAVREVVARIFSEEKLSDKDAEVISSKAAKIQATKPICETAKKQLADAEEMGKKNVNVIDLNHKIVNYCLQYCLIPEERAICEKKRL